MINIIIVEDNSIFNDIYIRIVKQVERNLKVKITIYSFFDYNSDFLNIMNSDIENKIYIFDIEAESNNGINISKEIRSKDKKSLIIFITAYYNKYVSDILTQTLLYLKYINKNDDYQLILKDTLTMAIKEIDLDHIFILETLECNYYIHMEDICYIYIYDRITYVITCYNEIICRKTIDEISNKLPYYFEKSHRACIVNLRKIKYIDKKNKLIYLSNNKTIDLVSRINLRKIITKLNKLQYQIDNTNNYD